MSGSGTEAPPPATEEQVRIIVYQTMEQMFLQSQASQKLLLAIEAKLAGAQAGTQAVAKIVDDNEARAATQRDVEARKQIVAYLYDQATRYVQLVIAGAYAAYFATVNIISSRIPDRLLEASALLMTLSLTVFVSWEVFNVTYSSFRIAKGNLEGSAWTTGLRLAWGAALLFSIITALPAIALSIWAYLRGIGAA